MPLQLPGDPQKNIDFYAGVLGLRLVKPGKTSAEIAPDHLRGFQIVFRAG
jgi:catechol 2,3-dioxygenase-like lactoylglutathione lyase family enzyme